MDDAQIIETLRRMRADAVSLYQGGREDPVLAGRVEYLVAYVQDTLRLKDPLHELLHVTELLEGTS